MMYYVRRGGWLPVKLTPPPPLHNTPTELVARHEADNTATDVIQGAYHTILQCGAFCANITFSP